VADQAVLRRVAELHAPAFRVSPQALFEELGNGRHAGLVHGYLKAQQQRLNDEGTARRRAAEKALGFDLEWCQDELHIRGRYCRHLSKVLLSLGGYWDGEGGLNRRCFIVPKAKGEEISKAFDRRQASMAKEAAILAQGRQVSSAFCTSSQK
jgi:hypothetical protein